MMGYNNCVTIKRSMDGKFRLRKQFMHQVVKEIRAGDYQKLKELDTKVIMHQSLELSDKEVKSSKLFQLRWFSVAEQLWA